MSPYAFKLIVICSIVIVLNASIDFTMARHMQSVEGVKSINVAASENLAQTNSEISWIHQMKTLRSGIKDCIKLTKDTTWNCLKKSSLHIFTNLMSAPVIPIWNGIRFVRANNTSAKDNQINDLTETYQRKDLQYLTWFDRLAMSLAKTLDTHVLQLNLKDLSEAYIKAVDKKENHKNLNVTDPIGTARHRRQRYNMIITMMFGVTALGAVLVPLGFQVLSVVSGKALLLAKMALLLASINGLKRVANSGVHYGLYHMPGDGYGGGYGHYDRGDVHHPRNVASVAVAQPMDYGLRK